MMSWIVRGIFKPAVFSAACWERTDKGMHVLYVHEGVNVQVLTCCRWSHRLVYTVFLNANVFR